MKDAVVQIASRRLTTESEIVREALLEYLESRGVSLHEEPQTPYNLTPADEAKIANVKAILVSRRKRHHKGSTQ